MPYFVGRVSSAFRHGECGPSSWSIVNGWLCQNSSIHCRIQGENLTVKKTCLQRPNNYNSEWLKWREIYHEVTFAAPELWIGNVQEVSDEFTQSYLVRASNVTVAVAVITTKPSCMAPSWTVTYTPWCYMFLGTFFSNMTSFQREIFKRKKWFWYDGHNQWAFRLKFNDCVL